MMALKVASARLEVAEKELYDAEEDLSKVQAILADLQKTFDDTIGKKNKLSADEKVMKKKMDQAKRLVNGLEDERKRWTEDANNFNDLKKRLIGDVAIACGFVS